MNVKAVVLAAGRGSRLKSMTDLRPKCLVEVAGKPLLSWQMDALKGAGIDDITLVGGYLAPMLEPFGCPVVINERWCETNMVSSLLCAGSLLESSSTVVSYSDILYPADHVRALMADDADIALTFDQDWLSLWQRRFDDPLGDAETFAVNDDGEVLEIGLKTDDISRIEGQFMGLLKFSPQGWRKTAELLKTLDQKENKSDRMDMTGLMMTLIQNSIRVKGVRVHGRWCECDSQNDIVLYESLLKTSTGKDRWSHDWR